MSKKLYKSTDSLTVLEIGDGTTGFKIRNAYGVRTIELVTFAKSFDSDECDEVTAEDFKGAEAFFRMNFTNKKSLQNFMHALEKLSEKI
jgi:hypothetical protein